MFCHTIFLIKYTWKGMVQDMNKKLKATSLPGRPSPDVAPYEAAHRETARIAAEEGFVLLKNEHDILPLAKNSKLALYGAQVSAV